jgi:hypothetical protein
MCELLHTSLVVQEKCNVARSRGAASSNRFARGRGGIVLRVWMENFLQLAQVGFGDSYGVGFASLVPRPPRCILLYCQVMNTGARCLELLLQRGDVFARGGRPATLN